MPCQHYSASRTSNNYDFWSNTENPQLMQCYLRYCHESGYRNGNRNGYQYHTIFNLNMSLIVPKCDWFLKWSKQFWIFVPKFAPCNIAMALNVILYFHYAMMPFATIYMKSVLRLWFSNKAVERTLWYIQRLKINSCNARADQFLYSWSSRKGVLEIHIYVI